jgi:hypothetical protein
MMSARFDIITADDFNREALELFEFQSTQNPLYRDYLKLIAKDVTSVTHWREIPCLPVSFFKSHAVKTGEWEPQLVFTSSGTSGQEPSRHLVRDPQSYIDNFTMNFRWFYGDPSAYCFLALLPSYMERDGSSLVFMAEGLIRQSSYPESGFFSDDFGSLHKLLISLRDRQVPVILLGVSYALLDLCERFPISFPELIVMETGGMKGRRKEMIRSELHELLCNGFGVKKIHSEYGMTELFSQAYSKGDGIYDCPPWMRVWLRDANDPLTNALPGQAGGINIIDLANYDTCAFIAVQDLGKVDDEGKFEVLGRFDDSELRGCNLMAGQLS